jgi:hypothetical protein
MRQDDLVKVWREVEIDVIDHQRTLAHIDGVDPTAVVGQAFAHWFSKKPPTIAPGMDLRSYLCGIARQILERKL